MWWTWSAAPSVLSKTESCARYRSCSKPSSIANGTLPFGGNAVQDLSVTTSFVLLTKTGTPPEVIERIYQGVKDVMMQNRIAVTA